MSSLIKNNIIYIHLLGLTSSKTQRKALLQTATKDQLKSLIELVYNVLYMRIPIAPHYQRNLKKKQSLLESLINRQKSQRYKFNTLRKNPAVIVLIIKAALPTLSTLK